MNVDCKGPSVIELSSIESFPFWNTENSVLLESVRFICSSKMVLLHPAVDVDTSSFLLWNEPVTSVDRTPNRFNEMIETVSIEK
jgi:hypothetical protein